ncbi:MAG: hypothetical protein ACK4N5_03265 [Myxococcales bacterium]
MLRGANPREALHDSDVPAYCHDELLAQEATVPQPPPLSAPHGLVARAAGEAIRLAPNERSPIATLWGALR